MLQNYAHWSAKICTCIRIMQLTTKLSSQTIFLFSSDCINMEPTTKIPTPHQFVILFVDKEQVLVTTNCCIISPQPYAFIAFNNNIIISFHHGVLKKADKGIDACFSSQQYLLTRVNRNCFVCLFVYLQKKLLFSIRYSIRVWQKCSEDLQCGAFPPKMRYFASQNVLRPPKMRQLTF